MHTPNKSEAMHLSSNSINGGPELVHSSSPEPSETSSTKQAVKIPVVSESLNQDNHTKELSTQLHQVGDANVKLSVSGVSGGSDSNKTKVGHAVASDGTAQLKDEEELRKKMLLSKLLTMGSGTSKSEKAINSTTTPVTSTSKKEATMYSYNSQPVAVPSPTLPNSLPSHQLGTMGLVSAASALTTTSVSGATSKPRINGTVTSPTPKTAATESLLQTKPSISNVAHSIPQATTTQHFTSIPTAAPYANIQSNQSPVKVPYTPVSTQQFQSQLVAVSSKTSISRPQAPSLLTSTTYTNPTGSVANVKENPYAFGSTFNSAAKTVTTFSQPAQHQVTSLQSPSINFGSTSRQQSTGETLHQGRLAKKTSGKIETDKKNELLAKLAAIDTHDDMPQESRASRTSSNQGSTTHLWPNTVQNLHQGKPAYATDNNPYGSRVLPTDTPKELGIQQSLNKFNSPGAGGRHSKIENKPSQSSIDGSALNRNASGLDMKSKKFGGGIFANIVGQNTGLFDSNPVGSKGTKAFSSGMKSMLNTGQIQTSNTSSFNFN